MKEKTKIYIKQNKKGKSAGSWLAYAPFTHMQIIHPDKKTALEYFVKNLHLRNYEVVEIN
jgi:hypothetical protein